jgi:hypothetical protein
MEGSLVLVGAFRATSGSPPAHRGPLAIGVALVAVATGVLALGLAVLNAVLDA